MFRSYRSIFLAIAGMILIGAGQPSDNGTTKSPIEQANKEKRQHELASAGIGHTGAAIETQNSKNDRYEKERNEREIRDLIAQEKSAYWAEAVFWATAFAVVVSAVGIILVFTTFKETKKANNIAKVSAFRQLRAYVTAEKATTSNVNFPDENQGFQGVRIVLHNSGATPAVGVSVTFKKMLFSVARPSRPTKPFLSLILAVKHGKK